VHFPVTRFSSISVELLLFNSLIYPHQHPPRRAPQSVPGKRIPTVCSTDNDRPVIVTGVLALDERRPCLKFYIEYRIETRIHSRRTDLLRDNQNVVPRILNLSSKAVNFDRPLTRIFKD
jgi:hypothetical protein